MQLSIQTDTATTLVALQGPQPVQNSIWMYVILVAVFSALALYSRSWKLAIFPILICVVGIVSFKSPGSEPSYRVSVNYAARQIHSEELAAGKVVNEQVLSAADIASAEMQFNRGATRIVLVLRNGEQRYPLGELHQQNEPEQYVVLTKLRDLIGQTAPPIK